MTPFEVVYGQPHPTISSYLPGSTKIAQLGECLVERQTLLARLKVNLARAQNRMKMQADRHRLEKQFSVNDWVLVKLQPYRQQSVVHRGSQKLANKYFGPYQITRKIGLIAYELRLPDGARIHPVFHVSLLKAFKGNIDHSVTPLPTTAIAGQPVMEPESVLQQREVQIQGKVHPQLLIKWKQMPEAEATWEWLEDIHTHYPAFNLEDKVVSEGEDIDTSPGVAEDSARARNRRQLKQPSWTKDYQMG